MTQPVQVVVAGNPSIVARNITRFPGDYGAALRCIPMAQAIGGREHAVILIDGQHGSRVAPLIQALLARPAVRAGLRRSFALVIDASGEGFPLLPKWVSAWHALLDEHDVPAGRVAYLTHNEIAAAGYRAWLRERGRSDGLRVLVHHPFMHRQALWLRENWSDLGERLRWLHAARTAPAQVLRKARFLCLNNKPHAHRMVIAGRILGSGLEQQTLLSFGGATKGVATWDMAAFLAKARAILPRFQADLDALEARLADLPLTIPGDDAVGRVNEVVFALPKALYGSALISLVPETDFTGRASRRFTEKSVKAFAAGHPVLLAALPGSLRLLRESGFASFDPYIDEAYDSIADPQDRLEAVLAETERIGAMSARDLGALLRRCLPAMEHNLRHAVEVLPGLMQRRLADVARVLAWMTEQPPAARPG